MDANETRTTDSKGRVTLPRSFANAPVIIEQMRRQLAGGAGLILLAGRKHLNGNVDTGQPPAVVSASPFSAALYTCS
jgi:hypothetical protein